MRAPTHSPRCAIERGLIAGALGTAAMTGHQQLHRRLEQGEAAGDGGGRAGDPWKSAPAPARAGRRVIESIFQRRVSPSRIPLLAQAMHWSYGTLWGAIYGLARSSTRAPTPVRGAAFGVAVWASSYAQLVPMGVYEPPWRYSPGELADDLAYHLTYGVGVAVAYEQLGRTC